ncbi:MAG: PEP-CTERM sorting domain-containing protein [Fimbriimonadaceae bacterium]
MKLVITSLVAASAAIASAQFSNDVIHTRVLNGAPGSTLTVTNNFPTSVEFSETNIENTTATPYANQHNWNLSPDGSTDTALGATESWSLSFTLDLSATGPTTLDKEAGFWLGNSGGAGQPGQFIVKSDGEIAQFGGNLTFHEFHTANSAGDYQLGTSILMSMAYDGTTNMMTSSETYNGVTQTFTDATTVVGGYNVGGYALYAVDTTGVSNTGDAVFSNIVPAPEPASMTMLALGAVALVRRHRKNKSS